ncbi:MAG: PKD domain-containing protein [Chloroflexota bacterium]
MRRPVIFLAIIAIVLLLTWGSSLREMAVVGKSPAQTLDQPMSQAQRIAQNVALANGDVQALTLGQRSEVFGVRDVGNQFTTKSTACAELLCQQVEIYNFDSNSTVMAIVDIENQTVLDVLDMPHLQPGINQRLADRAIEIALTHPDVIAELGFEPTEVDMAPVAGGLQGSNCDQHLCAAPTVRVGNRVLWAIVDLTDETLVGLNWTEVFENGRSETFNSNSGCPAAGSVNQMGWQLEYETTGTDGLRIFDASYNGRDVLDSATLAEWHVDYNGTYHIAGFLDVTGCGGGGGGFFIFPFGETEILDLVESNSTVGFEVVQDFRMSQWGEACHYRYEQRMQFYEDGRFRLVSGAYGRGCGFFPVYRSVLRVDLALDAAGQEQVGYWSGSRWVQPANELYLTPDSTSFGPAGHPLADNDAMLWLMNQGGEGFYLQPAFGQFDDAGRGDEPFVYITKYAESEGVTDLPVFGGLCCEDNHEQGPHNFVNDEPVQDENVVIWYVAQHDTEVNLDNNSQNYCWTVSGDPTPEAYPCFGGPLFVPFGYDTVSLTADFIQSDTAISYPNSVDFTNQSIVVGNVPVNYEWDFGDGTSAVGENVSHQYLREGPFTPSLRVNGFLNGANVAEGTAVNVTVENLFLPSIFKP